jgi:hypothetical protein
MPAWDSALIDGPNSYGMDRGLRTWHLGCFAPQEPTACLQATFTHTLDNVSHLSNVKLARR